MSSAPREERLSKRHWIVSDIFDIAKEQGLHSPNYEPLARKVQEEKKINIPIGTLKHWANGHSAPKIDQIDALAAAVGYSLELVLEPVKGEAA